MCICTTLGNQHTVNYALQAQGIATQFLEPNTKCQSVRVRRHGFPPERGAARAESWGRAEVSGDDVADPLLRELRTRLERVSAPMSQLPSPSGETLGAPPCPLTLAVNFLRLGSSTRGMK